MLSVSYFRNTQINNNDKELFQIDLRKYKTQRDFQFLSASIRLPHIWRQMPSHIVEDYSGMASSLAEWISLRSTCSSAAIYPKASKPLKSLNLGNK
jgi:hypothetical protein